MPSPPPPPPLALPPAALPERLSSVLPKDHLFGIYHLSTPPRRTDALFSAPPNQRHDRTYCEKHFLALSIHAPSKPHSPRFEDAKLERPAPDQREVLVLGLEIFLFTTAHSTILFVSKADSTGHLPRLGLLRSAASPIRDACAAFIAYLVQHRRRAGIQFVVSLFARSQGQYLFPGSVEHGGKHVLDDGGLIKWWCKVLDPLVRPGKVAPQGNAKGYLLVPGLDAYETRAFIPAGGTPFWAVAHPLRSVSRYGRESDCVPPRCLIPRFPDDPKCRLRDELDDEAGSGAMKHTGRWKSVKTLDMFWEMMAYRQECSSGRMTGFIWVVLDDKPDDCNTNKITAINGHRTWPALPTDGTDANPSSTAPAKPDSPKTTNLNSKSKSKFRSKAFKRLKGPIKPRQPKAKTQSRNHHVEIPSNTAYYYWPRFGRGSRIVNETTYKRMTELMLHSDFSSLDKAVGSTARWIKEGGVGSGDWGCVVSGEREALVQGSEGGVSCGAAVNDLGGLVKRKRAEGKKEASVANVLGAGVVRKKAKT